MAEEQPRVLTASVHDFRYFAALLRGVNFVNRASVSITADGFTVTVEEARCLTGEPSLRPRRIAPDGSFGHAQRDGTRREDFISGDMLGASRFGRYLLGNIASKEKISFLEQVVLQYSMLR